MTYEKPEVEITIFSTQDVIQTSGGGGDIPGINSVNGEWPDMPE